MTRQHFMLLVQMGVALAWVSQEKSSGMPPEIS